jgi:hypothetical protein
MTKLIYTSIGTNGYMCIRAQVKGQYYLLIYVTKKSLFKRS